jgi:hypothetical protein
MVQPEIERDPDHISCTSGSLLTIAPAMEAQVFLHVTTDENDIPTGIERPFIVYSRPLNSRYLLCSSTKTVQPENERVYDKSTTPSVSY